MDELGTIFADMGFAIAEGPDIETDDYNFYKAEFSRGPSAREMRHIFLQSETRTGSEPGQAARACCVPTLAGAGAHMLTQNRRSASSVRAAPIDRFRCHAHTEFQPGRGLVIDKGLHLGHLKWILHEISASFFEVDHINMRFRRRSFRSPSRRSSRYPCRRDKGEIRFGEGEDWLEFSLRHGASEVLRACGIDPDVYRALPGAWASTALRC